KIRGVKLRAGDLGNAVNPADAGRCRIPAIASGQDLARIEAGLFGHRQTRQGQGNAARGGQLDELASRSPHALYPLMSAAHQRVEPSSSGVPVRRTGASTRANVEDIGSIVTAVMNC